MISVDLYHDVGPSVGLGHRRRMFVLERELTRRNIRVGSYATDAPRPSGDATVAVVDSYLVRADDGSFPADHIVAIDDLDRDLDVDLVVRPGAVGVRQPSSSACELRGLEFALVDVVPQGEHPIEDQAHAVLVTLGGSDRAGLGAEIAVSLAGRRRDVNVSHAPGPWSRRVHSKQVTTIEPSDGLAGQLLDADVVVTAGGVTMLESLALGRPTVVVVTAVNQRAQASAAAAADAAVVLDAADGTSAIVRSAEGLIDDPARRWTFAERARTLIDGRGGYRVVEAILDLV